MRAPSAGRRLAPTPPYRPALLDQVSAAQLSRLAAARIAPDQPAQRAPRAQKARRSNLGGVRRLVLALAILAFSGLITAGIAYGAVDTLGREDGLSWQDWLRLTLMALLVFMFVGQLLGVLRMLPGVSWLASRLRRPTPLPAPTPLPLLDQVSAAQLARLMPAGFGQAHRSDVLAARARRGTDLASWVAAVVLVVGIMVLFGTGTVFGAWDAVVAGEFSPSLVFTLLIGGLIVFALVTLVRTGLGGLRDRRLRRRRRLLRRILRYLLRLFDRARGAPRPDQLAPGGAGWPAAVRPSGPGPVAAGGVVTAGVLALALLPALAGGGGEADAHALPTPTATVLAPIVPGDATHTPSPAGPPGHDPTTAPASDPTATIIPTATAQTSSPTPGSGEAATPEPTATAAPTTPDPSGTGTPAPPPAPATPTGPPPATATPTASPPPTPTPTPPPTPTATATQAPTPTPSPTATPSRPPDPTPTPCPVGIPCPTPTPTLPPRGLPP